MTSREVHVWSGSILTCTVSNSSTHSVAALMIDWHSRHVPGHFQIYINSFLLHNLHVLPISNHLPGRFLSYPSNKQTRQHTTLPTCCSSNKLHYCPIVYSLQSQTFHSLLTVCRALEALRWCAILIYDDVDVASKQAVKLTVGKSLSPLLCYPHHDVIWLACTSASKSHQAPKITGQKFSQIIIPG